MKLEEMPGAGIGGWVHVPVCEEKTTPRALARSPAAGDRFKSPGLVLDRA